MSSSDKYQWLLVGKPANGGKLKLFTSDDLSLIQAEQREWESKGYETTLRTTRKAQA